MASTRVQPLHHVTVEIRWPDGEYGRCRFIYGVETLAPGLDSILQGREQDAPFHVELQPETRRHLARRFDNLDAASDKSRPEMVELRVLEISPAEPREVVKALASTVRCCCGHHHGDDCCP